MDSVAALFLIFGREELKKEKKTIGYLLIIIAVFNLFVSVQDFIVN
ncbi:DUF3953 domain-containing protein [Bacillus sinesaloumensis]|nr:DUF3953 domain-containing protein [Bacillus sinesaloumensis]